jgi:hypothetical protein
MWNTTRTGPSVIRLGNGDFAGFPAIRAIVFAIGAQPDVLLALAIATIAVASALFLQLVTLSAQNRVLHVVPYQGAAGRDAATAKPYTTQYRPLQRSRTSTGGVAGTPLSTRRWSHRREVDFCR